MGRASQLTKAATDPVVNFGTRPPLSVARILVVDDEALDRMIIDSLLTAEGHELVVTDNGESALRLYRAQKFDLVVTDLVMRGINGLRLIRKICEQDPNATIIAITGISPEHLPLAQDYGAVGTLTKPIDRDVLLGTIDEALARNDSEENVLL